jgi:2-acylglycerol O-acyltransferase 2
VAASSVFSIPFWRHFIAWMGSVPATRGNFKRILKKGSVAVVVGGIAEM